MDLDTQILKSGSVSLYLNTAILEEDITWFNQNNYQIFRFDCLKWATVEAFHEDISNILKFPDYYGRNLDALNDSLGDNQAFNSDKILLVFYSLQKFAREFPETAWQILDIIALNSRYFLVGGMKLLLLIQSDDPSLYFEPVGATSVLWNRKEWLNKNRGL